MTRLSIGFNNRKKWNAHLTDRMDLHRFYFGENKGMSYTIESH